MFQEGSWIRRCLTLGATRSAGTSRPTESKVTLQKKIHNVQQQNTLTNGNVFVDFQEYKKCTSARRLRVLTSTLPGLPLDRPELGGWWKSPTNLLPLEPPLFRPVGGIGTGT